MATAGCVSIPARICCRGEGIRQASGGFAVFMDRVGVIAEHPGIFSGLADGVVQATGELGEVSLCLRCQLLHFLRRQTTTGITEELAGF